MIRNFFNSPIFSTFVVRTFFVAKYRTVTKNFVSSLIPCSLSFYTTIAFKSYIPPTFSERMFFISCIVTNDDPWPDGTLLLGVPS